MILTCFSFFEIKFKLKCRYLLTMIPYEQFACAYIFIYYLNVKRILQIITNFACCKPYSCINIPLVKRRIFRKFQKISRKCALRVTSAICADDVCGSLRLLRSSLPSSRFAYARILHIRVRCFFVFINSHSFICSGSAAENKNRTFSTRFTRLPVFGLVSHAG